jgi:arsenate reductase (glutaredoxin)
MQKFSIPINFISLIIKITGIKMDKITVYEKPTCTTCRKVSKILIENGVDFEKVNYYIKPFTKNKLKILLQKMNLKPSELLRKNEQAYKDLNFKTKNFSEEEILDLMIKNPDLVQRPIVEKGSKAILARPPEKINELF